MVLHSLHVGLTVVYTCSVWSISSEVLPWTRILSPETANVEIQKIMELLKEKVNKQGILREGEISHSCHVLKQGQQSAIEEL